MNSQTVPPVLEVENLVVEYGKAPKVTRAVDGISFRVNPGECVGFIGANGAGKSTTMKSLMGFIFPKSGSIRVFGEPAGTAESRLRIGYLPEVALYYPFMKARELLELYGGLQGLSKADLKRLIPETLEKVGLAGKGETLLKQFSKGMQQRLGIAQAIIADPEALIFDELSSGLDPVGRFDLREVLLDLKRKGRTIFFSSHELSEVETLCDRVIMIHKGRVVTEAPVSQLLKPLNQFELVFRPASAGAPPAELAALNPAREGEQYRLHVSDPAQFSKAITAVVSSGGTVVSTASRSRTLEEYFIELVQGRDGSTSHSAGAAAGGGARS